MCHSGYERFCITDPCTSFLQIFDKLSQSFNGDVLQTLFNSAEGLASCQPENMRFWLWRFLFDQVLAMAASNIQNLSMII